MKKKEQRANKLPSIFKLKWNWANKLFVQQKLQPKKLQKLFSLIDKGNTQKKN